MNKRSNSLSRAVAAHTTSSAAPCSASARKRATAKEDRLLQDRIISEGALAVGLAVTYPNGDQLILEAGWQAQSLIAGKLQQ